MEEGLSTSLLAGRERQREILGIVFGGLDEGGTDVLDPFLEAIGQRADQILDTGEFQTGKFFRRLGTAQDDGNAAGSQGAGQRTIASESFRTKERVVFVARGEEAASLRAGIKQRHDGLELGASETVVAVIEKQGKEGSRIKLHSRIVKGTARKKSLDQVGGRSAGEEPAGVADAVQKIEADGFAGAGLRGADVEIGSGGEKLWAIGRG